jgi:uncharacterized protein (TIGR00304 family)
VADSAAFFVVGLVVIFIGVLVLVVAAILAGAQRKRKGKATVAGAIIIGPVPIIFGSDKKTVKSPLVLSLVLTALSIIAMLIYYFLFR